MARPMPVLPEVGSRMMVSGLILPACSAASIIDTAIRSLTLCAGLKNSSLARMVASTPAFTRLSCTSGVLPTSSRIFFANFMMVMFSQFDVSVNQEYGCQPQENKEPPAVGDGSDHHAGADGRVAPHLLHVKRNGHADEGAHQKIEQHRAGHHNAERYAVIQD